ncbi:hypothetical protein BB559_005045 [Furculomyces boomerangus]|uniref:Cytidyltransferase-like domain-containing protein n=1 Tax=Furculomyces boomerangus TaxID=61424 RepID=A0A2T9YB32_9FUNG|nr:hypothetical protein BB559_005045 [Furculomyces boomerangus]
MGGPPWFIFLSSVKSAFTSGSKNLVAEAVRNSNKDLLILFSISKNKLENETGSQNAFKNLSKIISFFYIQMEMESKGKNLETRVVWLDGCGYNKMEYDNLLKNPGFVNLRNNKISESKFFELDTESRGKLAERFGNEIVVDGANHAAVGGTFDHLHVGHKILLSMTAYSSGSKVTCGITDEPLLKNKKFKEFLEPMDQRTHKVLDFFNTIKKGIDYNLVPLQDPFGPIIVDETVDTLVVSEETIVGTDKANEIRLSKSMKPMEIVPIDLVSDFDSAAESKNADVPEGNTVEKISSTEIRKRLHLEHQENTK